MLTAHNLSKTYGIQTILKNVTFNISTGERIGLVGPNGCGKTTLIRILAGKENPDEGRVVHTRPNLRIGYLAQGMEFQPGQTLRAALEFDTISQSQLESDLASLATLLAKDPDNLQLQEQYDEVLTGFSTVTIQPESILGPLGLGGFNLDETPISHLSGGQKTRLMLARILLEDPNLLLLDEPTNHLDIVMLEWLEDWLSRFHGAVLIVSHDRAFLDNTVKSILDLNPQTHTFRAYKGNYSDYLDQFRKEQEKQLAIYRDQQAEVRRMEQDIARTKEQSRRVEVTTTSRQPGVRRIAKKVAKKALSREKKLKRYLGSDERVEKPDESWQMKLEFSEASGQSKDVLQAENLSVGYSGHKPLLEGLNLFVSSKQRIALIGENGTGKTTLLRTITGFLTPLAGSIKLGQTVRIGYMAQEQDLVDTSLSALDTIRKDTSFNETEARHFLHLFLFGGDDSLRPINDLSFGERSRLQLALLVAQGCTFLVLDEPINHLDIPSRTRFEKALTQFNGSTLAVVHDRYFIDSFATHVWTIKNGKVAVL